MDEVGFPPRGPLLTPHPILLPPMRLHPGFLPSFSHHSVSPNIDYHVPRAQTPLRLGVREESGQAPGLMQGTGVELST